MNPHYHVCHACDTLNRISTPEKPGRYKCANCGSKLYTYKPGMVERMYALNLAALFLFILTNYFPFLSFHVAGSFSHANFATTIVYLYEDHEWLLGTAILMTTIIIPLLRILIYTVLFGSLYHDHLPRYATQMLKTVDRLLPWGMVDVFFLGILVSIVKLVKMGTIIPGISLWAFILMVFIMAWSQSIYDPHQVWERIGKRRKILKQYEEAHV